jgi:hypothetical protein
MPNPDTGEPNPRLGLNLFVFSWILKIRHLAPKSMRLFFLEWGKRINGSKNTHS